MKKGIVFLGITLLLISGCAYPIAANLMTPDVNAENFCAISFSSSIKKIVIDGKKYSPPNMWLANLCKTFILPPGHHKIEVEYYGTNQQNSAGDFSYSSYNVYQPVFEGEFQNGQFYFIYSDKCVNETNPTEWKSVDAVNDAKARRKGVEKKLGIKQ